MVNKTYYSNDDMEEGIASIVTSLKKDKWVPDVVVGVLRGGVIPAVYLSHAFDDTPMVSLSWSTRDTAVGKELSEELDGYLFSDSKILIVDDICDSGLTLVEIYEALGERYFEEKLVHPAHLNIRSAVLHYNVGQDDFTPDYHHVVIDKNVVNEWLVYPWET